jgi:hypothetical protein
LNQYNICMGYVINFFSLTSICTEYKNKCSGFASILWQKSFISEILMWVCCKRFCLFVCAVLNNYNTISWCSYLALYCVDNKWPVYQKYKSNEPDSFLFSLYPVCAKVECNMNCTCLQNMDANACVCKSWMWTCKHTKRGCECPRVQKHM